MCDTHRCITCGMTKTTSEFDLRRDSGKIRNTCRECRAEREVARRYNMSILDVRKLKEELGDSCGICGISSSEITHTTFKYNPLVIDHDHLTGEIRGLLCPNCNLVLGHATDNTQILLNAIIYLNRKPK